MKVTILPENIISYLPLLGKILPSHSQVPILGNVLLEANSDGFFIKVTDLEMGGEIKVPAKVDEMGAITIPGREFLETINSLPKDKIVIETKGEGVVLSCRDTRISFSTISSEEFPKLYKSKGVEVARFARSEFVDIFSYLIFSVSNEETRPQLTGIYIDNSDGKINFVSTDGYRMSVKTMEKQKKIGESLIVAVGLISEVISLKSDDDVVMYVNKEESQIIFEIGSVIVLGRMIEGQFPDYARVLPQESGTVVTFEREELLRCVRLASVFARDNSNIANLAVEGNTLRISTRAQGVGEGEAVVDCVKVGADNKISFNIKYLMDLLKTVVDKQIVLKLNSPTEPALFEVVEKNFAHVIMPIQVD